MKYNQLDINKNKQATRKGRGISSGKGKTAGRGTKGQNSRAGGRRRPGFEGGQTPYAQRMPKLRGISKGGRTITDKIYHAKQSEQVTTQQLNTVEAKAIDNFVLFEAGLVRNPHTKVKVILKGEIKNKVTVNLQSASKNAIEAIVKAGGVFNRTPQVKRMPKADKK